MRKIIFAILCISLATHADASTNPMFGDGDINSVTIHIAQSTGSHNIRKLIWPFDWDIYPQTFLMATYSQPVTVFRLPARINLNILQNIAYESSHGLSFIGTGVSWDISLFDYRGFYIGIGIGPYYRDNHDRWLSSRFMFGEKVFLGKNISEHWRGELFTQHFSNGDITDVNTGFNFFGLAINYSF
ncbi:MAG: acyloxyacyl hydrolase [Alphaproteobacteria bacterium]|nr:acyloxyacyl hydrolase [Alphaproteobacteria bacterium]